VKFFLFILILVLDQVTKYLAVSYLSGGVVKEVVPEFFNLVLVYNPGAAFGMFAGLGDEIRRFVLLGMTAIALVVVLFMQKEVKGDRLSEVALVVILAGAIGNLIDRVRFDSVIDFLDLYIGQYHWPAFNIADSAICIGVALLLVRMIFVPDERKQVGSVEPEAA